MCHQLYAEDPSPFPIPPENIQTTLATLQRDPSRGSAVVLDVEGSVCGYALLIAFWSNELGGDICQVDELFVLPQHRKQGHGSALFAAIVQENLWPGSIAAIELGVTPNNVNARRLYERLGFVEIGSSLIRRVTQKADIATSPERSV